MDQPTSSNSSSFEDLAKDAAEAVEDSEKDDFMDILGNKQLTKKVGQFNSISQYVHHPQLAL